MELKVLVSCASIPMKNRTPPPAARRPGRRTSAEERKGPDEEGQRRGRNGARPASLRPTTTEADRALRSKGEADERHVVLSQAQRGRNSARAGVRRHRARLP